VAGEGRALVAFDPGRVRVWRYNHPVLSRQQYPEVFPLAACPRLAENSRLGFETVASTSRWGSGFSISSSTLGFQASLYDGRVGSRTTGKERDTESGNDYFEARYYSSTMGRFMSPDPLMFNELRLVNPQRWNMYAYAVNNPLIFTDPTGLDAVAVTFTTKIPAVGHTGIMSVHSDGNITFAQYGPQGGAKPYGVGEVTEFSTEKGQLPKLSFSNGQPTDASLSALKDKLGSLEGVSPGSIKLAYFKTSSSETAALDDYINNWYQASQTGKLRYFFFGASCVTFCQQGMKAAGQPDFHSQMPIPNLLGFNWWWASGQGTREEVTHKICDADGKNCH
jgi:RHS repeat-associated protein